MGINALVGTFMFCLVCASGGDFTGALGLAACIMAFGASMNPAANFQEFAKGGFKDVEGFAYTFIYQLVGAAAANMAAAHIGGFTFGSAPSNEFEQGAFIREALGTMFFLAAAGSTDNAVRTGFALMASVAVFGGTYNPAVQFSRIGINGIADNLIGFAIVTAANFVGAFLANVSNVKVK